MAKKIKSEELFDKDSLKSLIKSTLLDVLAEIKNTDLVDGIPVDTKPKKSTKITKSPTVSTKINVDEFKRPPLEDRPRGRFNENGELIASYGKSIPAVFTENTFSDDGTISSDQRKETEAQKIKLTEGLNKRSPRRTPASKVKVTCSKCDAKFEVFKAGVASVNYYICNVCARKSHL